MWDPRPSRILTVLLALAWCLVCPVTARAGPSLVLLYPDPPGTPVDHAARAFKREVERRTHRQVRIELYPGGRYHGQVLGEIAISRLVQGGDVDQAIVTTAPLANYSRALEILDAPFLFQDYPQVYRTLDGEVGRTLLRGLLSSGLRGLAFMDSGFRIFTSAVPLTSLSDLKGKRIRIMQNEIYQHFIRLIGAIPVAASVEKVNDMARRGYIDAADRSYPSYWAYGLNHVHRCILESDHAYAACVLIANDRSYRKLDATQKAAIMAAAGVARDDQRRQFRQAVADVRGQCLMQGIRITRLSDADRQAMRAACEPIYRRLRVQYAGLMHLLEP